MISFSTCDAGIRLFIFQNPTLLNFFRVPYLFYVLYILHFLLVQMAKFVKIQGLSLLQFGNACICVPYLTEPQIEWNTSETTIIEL